MKAFQVLYVLCFTRPRYQVSVYRTTGPLVFTAVKKCSILHRQVFVMAVILFQIEKIILYLKNGERYLSFILPVWSVYIACMSEA